LLIGDVREGLWMRLSLSCALQVKKVCVPGRCRSKQGALRQWGKYLIYMYVFKGNLINSNMIHRMWVLKVNCSFFVFVFDLYIYLKKIDGCMIIV
jgi:hypothetical protein